MPAIRFILPLILLAAACKPAGPPEVVVIPKASANRFWPEVKAGAEAAGRDLGVTVRWSSPEQESDRQRQIELMQEAVSSRAAAIVLAPLDSRSLIPSVKAARSRKIPVVIFDSGLDEAVYASFVGTDNRKAGEACAQHLGVLLAGKGLVAVLRYQEGSSSTTEREEGFMAAMRAASPGISLRESPAYSGASVKSAYEAARTLLAGMPEVKGIFCPNETSLTGTLQALEEAGLAGQVALIGFDSNERLLEGLKRGTVSALLIQDPRAIGYEGVKAAVQALRGQAPAARIETPVLLLTTETLGDPEIRKRLVF
ncbi:MAG: substrate-binding domain-containing protein [Bacteroidia bacterium]|nr:substrate-binding domain-containing protein [Bacteroidia bacterium]